MFAKFQVDLQEWSEKHKNLGQSLKKFSNLSNQSSFIHSASIHDSLGHAVKPTKTVAKINCEIESTLSDMKLLSEELTAIVWKLVTTESDIVATSNPDVPVEVGTLQCLVAQIKQQSLLNSCIIDELTERFQNGLVNDQDCLQTMLASLTYSPFLDTSDLEDIMSLPS